MPCVFFFWYSGRTLTLSIYKERCEEARKLMAENKIDYLFVGSGTDMTYICDYVCTPNERLRLFVLPVDGRPSFITPAFEVPAFKLGKIDVFFDLISWEETEDPMKLLEGIVNHKKKATIAIDDKHWGMFFVEYLKILPSAEFVSAGPVLGEMRICKDATEVHYMKELGKALDEVWEEALKLEFGGRRESELVSDLSKIKERFFKPPVERSPRGENRPLSGINSSSAHGGGLDRVIQKGDAIYWEMGRGVCHGYIGDKTRSVQVAPSTEEYRKVYNVVKKAQQTAFEAIRPGRTCESIDLAGRRVIKEAGYGEYFTHRIGHGLGLDVHEPPYMVEGNKRKLEPGMIFSVEPGIYLPGKWGIRIEDIVYVTADGAESFYSSTKDFHEVK